MEQEDKELLIRDLCARLPYHTKVSKAYWVSNDGKFELEWDEKELTSSLLNYIEEDNAWEHIKPYLRPMSSMTEEEYDQLYIDSRVKEDSVNILDALANDLDAIDWLNAHHFDYRGLIEKDLAIEITEDNNPYEN